MCRIRLLVLAALVGSALFAADATPIGGDDIALPLGNGNIVIRHIRVDGLELLIQIRNATSYPLQPLKLQFDIGGTCNNQPRQWTVPFTTSLRASAYTDTKVNLDGNVDECAPETIKASLVDLKKQLDAINAKRDADLARRERLAAEEKRKQAEAETRYVKAKAEDEAKAIEERRRIRVACSTIYHRTADKKIRDLTVREEQQVRACQALGLYPPQ